jgi:lipoyl(octanoyl) transferase
MPIRGWVLDLGLIGYGQAYTLQRQLHAARLRGDIPDTLLLLEHPPVITLGKGFRAEHLLFSPEFYVQRGIEVCPTDRGGDVTCHMPGQLVGYPIFDLRAHGRDLHRFLRQLEEGLIRLLSEYGIQAGRMSGYTGVWVGNEKIAAIGIKVARWVSMHGFALNVNNDLSLFRLIVPCGIADRGVTSIRQLLGKPFPMPEVKARAARQLGAVFGLELCPPETPLESVLAAV